MGSYHLSNMRPPTYVSASRSTFSVRSLLALAGLAATTCLACAAGGTTEGQSPAGSDPTGDPAKAENVTPHALGTIMLGESHTSQAQSAPIISAAFVPDAADVASAHCGNKVGACEVTQAPTCKTGTASGCASGETCQMDASCDAKCVAVAVCTTACQSDEECYATGAGTTSATKFACRRKVAFDAGVLAFAGITSSMTLFPPYAVKPTGNGAPFLAKSEIRVQASGASTAGFSEFDEKFTATTFLETTPALSAIPKATVFGTAALPIGWMPGTDQIVITATGSGASATCAADDASGKFEIPREVLDQVTTSSSTSSSSASALSITVTRRRVETRRNKALKANVDGNAIATGWLDLVTMSTESASFQACPSSQTLCDDVCVSLQSSTSNCGACGNACSSSYYCSSGSCQ
jgi:Stigma-specific protein, Stig1